MGFAVDAVEVCDDGVVATTRCALASEADLASAKRCKQYLSVFSLMYN